RSEEVELDSRLWGCGRERGLRLIRREDGGFSSEQRRQPGEALLEHGQHLRGVKGGRRVIERIEERLPAPKGHRLLLTMDARDAELLARKQLRREVAERGDHA